MHTDKVLPTRRLKGSGIYNMKELAFYSDTPTNSIINLRRAALTADEQIEMSAQFKDIGEVKDVPTILLAPSVALLIGDTWTGIIETSKPIV